MTGPTTTSSSRLANLALAVTSLALAANIAFNVVMAMAGAHYPYTVFLFNPADLWADFFKMAFSFPGAAIHPPIRAWPIQDHIDNMKRVAELYHGTQINPDHMPPVATLLAVLARRAMTFCDPVVLFGILVWLGVSAVVIVVTKLAAEQAGGRRWAIVALLSYPLIYQLDRGHFFSMLCSLTLIGGCGRLIRIRRLDFWATLLLAVAINLRPHVAAVPAILMLSGQIGRPRDVVLLGTASVAVLAAAMAAAHAIYPHYGPATWLAGLADYRQIQIEMPIHYGFQTSLPSVLTLAFGYEPALYAICLMLGGALAVAILLLASRDRLTIGQSVFLALCLSVFVTPAFADYHLFPFVLPAILIAREKAAGDPASMIAFAASLAMLIPKNYFYEGKMPVIAWSYQVVLNPLLLLVAAFAIIAMASRSRSEVNGPLEVIN